MKIVLRVLGTRILEAPLLSLNGKSVTSGDETAEARIKQLERLLKTQPHSKFKAARKNELSTLLKKVVKPKKATEKVSVKFKNSIPDNYNNLPVEKKMEHAKRVLKGINFWVSVGEDGSGYGHSKDYVRDMLHAAKVLGVLEDKSKTLYRRLTFSTKSFKELIDNNKPIPLKDRSATSWCEGLNQAKDLDLSVDAHEADAVTFLVRHKVTTPFSTLHRIAESLISSVPAGIARQELQKHLHQDNIKMMKREKEVLVTGNGGLNSIAVRDIALVDRNGKWTVPKANETKPNPRSPDFALNPERENTARKEFEASSVVKALQKELSKNLELELESKVPMRERIKVWQVRQELLKKLWDIQKTIAAKYKLPIKNLPNWSY